MRGALLSLLLVLAGCGGESVAPDGGVGLDAYSPPPPDAGPAEPTPDARVPLPGRDAGVEPSADGGAPDAGPPPPDDVRFVLMGDTGEGNADQRAVAVAIRDYCALEGCDFVILLGDNIYDSGASSVDDPQWTTKFEDPYRDVELPFYAVLGNHDYGGVLFGRDSGGLGNEWDKGPVEVMYSARSTKWTMPDTHYTFQVGNVGFVMMDTNSILWDDTTNGDQRAWFPGAVADLRASGADWIMAAGHHPLRSNGAHGNAGSYESLEIGGVDVPIPIPIMDGRNFRRFMHDYVCGNVDFAFAGHDHNRQWLDEPDACGGTELVVNGAGAKTKSFDRDDRNAAHWQNDAIEGFMYVHISGDTMIGRFIDSSGAVEYERMLMRPSASW